jgi:hypothetical protein
MVAGFYRADDDPGNFLGKRVALERITLLSPSVGYKVTDELSVGLSVGLSYQAVALETDFRAPNELLGMMRIIDEEICPPFKDESNIVIDLFLFGFCNAQQGIGPFDNLPASRCRWKSVCRQPTTSVFCGSRTTALHGAWFTRARPK